MTTQGTLRLVAGYSSKTGAPVYEEILAEVISATRWRVLRSPGFVQGIAAGDEIELADREESGFRVLHRAGNLSVQFFSNGDLHAAEAFLTERISSIGGWLDGRERSTLVYTVPVAAGFPAIEGVMKEAVERFPESEWGFGNVYDPRDGMTPLNWWRTP